ncbi:MAG: hypothetical protein EBV10_11950, partial [Synechococcaceae bacterium WB6_1A_059]|nr:hypothetical protein [Synechococcaceae bacterium WB6_1A_059]
INTKISKAAVQTSNEDRFFKLLESMDWKLWEIYLMLKDFKEAEFISKKVDTTGKKPTASVEKPTTSTERSKKKFIDKVE